MSGEYIRTYSYSSTECLSQAGNLKAIIGWCVYFVLNNSGSTMGASCADAKVILTQLLTLPDFHRPELRCFTVGCLAILAKVLFE